MIFTGFFNHVASPVIDLKPFQDFDIAVVIVIIDYCSLMSYHCKEEINFWLKHTLIICKKVYCTSTPVKLCAAYGSSTVRTSTDVSLKIFYI
jgi:hypothetical protein